MSNARKVRGLGLTLAIVLLGLSASGCGSGTPAYTPPPATEVRPAGTAAPVVGATARPQGATPVSTPKGAAPTKPPATPQPPSYPVPTMPYPGR